MASRSRQVPTVSASDMVTDTPSPPAVGSITVATGPIPTHSQAQSQSQSQSQTASQESTQSRGEGETQDEIVAAGTSQGAAMADSALARAGLLTSSSSGTAEKVVGEEEKAGRGHEEKEGKGETLVGAATTTTAAAAAGPTDKAATPALAPQSQGSGSSSTTSAMAGSGEARQTSTTEGKGSENAMAVDETASRARRVEDVDGMDGVEQTGGALATAPAAGEAVLSSTAASTSAVAGSSAAAREITRGAFIVFEGMDRAGKTTQAKLLQQRCIESGREVKYMRFPDRETPIGQMIDAYLRGETETEDHVIHLLFSANRWEAINKIKSLLASGTTIICDRYYHSGIVYSAAKQLPSLSLAWAKAPEVGLPRPDLVLFLDLDEDVARSRGGWGGEIYEKGEMQRRVRELFWGLSMGDLGSKGSGSGSSRDRAMAKKAGAAVPGVAGPEPDVLNEFRQEEEDIQIVDANSGVEELAEKVWDVIVPRLEAVERGEVGKTVRIVH